MNKNWRFTAALGIGVIILGAIYLLSGTTATTPIAKLSDRVLPGLASEQVTKIEVSRKDGVSMTFEKATDAVG
ncbi:MAG TPA: hypothetical protein VKW04_14300, partial [Planctomycetota bacterium]|nr:hypothetical protein [Planctomycetota bacterium]